MRRKQSNNNNTLWKTLLFLSSRCQNETSNIPTPPFFMADLLTTDVHTNLSFHLGIFGPCFQPVFRQWKEESERFWFYLSSMGWLCCFFWRWKVFQYLWNIIAGLAARGISFCLHPILQDNWNEPNKKTMTYTVWESHSQDCTPLCIHSSFTHSNTQTWQVPRCLNMRLRKAQKHVSKIRRRLKGLKALLFMSSIMRSQRFLCFNRIPLFPLCCSQINTI